MLWAHGKRGGGRDQRLMQYIQFMYVMLEIESCTENQPGETDREREAETDRERGRYRRSDDRRRKIDTKRCLNCCDFIISTYGMTEKPKSNNNNNNSKKYLRCSRSDNNNNNSQVGKVEFSKMLRDKLFGNDNNNIIINSQQAVHNNKQQQHQVHIIIIII